MNDRTTIAFLSGGLFTVLLVDYLTWLQLIPFNYNWFLEPLFLCFATYIGRKYYSECWIIRYWPVILILSCLGDIVLNVCFIFKTFSLTGSLFVMLIPVPSFVIWLKTSQHQKKGEGGEATSGSTKSIL